MTICTGLDAARSMIHRVGCARVRHLQTRYLWHQRALREGQFNVVRCGTKENPSDLGTKVLEIEAMASCMSKLAIILAATLRGAIVAALARATSPSDDVTVDGCCSKRVGNTTTGVVNTADPVSTFMASVAAGRAVVVVMLVWRAAMSKYSVWSRQTRRHSVKCAGLSGTAWSCAVFCCSAQSVLCGSCPAQQVLVFLSLVVATVHLVHETVCS